MRALLIILVIIAAIGGAFGAFVWFGVFNASAVDHHWGVTLELIETVRDRSIMARSQGISLPPLAPEDSALLKNGVATYHKMCRDCHAAPGYREEVFAQGLYPAPADLMSGEIQTEWNDKALFWIVCNGLKMTGMPSFCVTHDKEELYGVIAMLRRLPKMKSPEYRALVEETGAPE